MDTKTTSYELSLRLKEQGVEQEGGEYYWVNTQAYELDPEDCLGADILTQRVICVPKSIVYDGEIICRAFTLGELVRELPSFAMVSQIESGLGIFGYATDHIRTIQGDTPEEAAGELYCEILKQKA